jgi:hypothetical protein
MTNEDLKVMREKFLSDCPPDQSFWTCNGTIVRNIYELKNTIRALNDFAFRYHVNDDNHKNDFASWIFHVLGDARLSSELKKVRNKDKYVRIIEKRIKDLESA